MTRPYKEFHYQDLRQLFERSLSDRKVLRDILNELQHRKTPKAVALKKDVEDCLNTLDKAATTEGSSSDRHDSAQSAVKEKTEVEKTSGPTQEKDNESHSGPGPNDPDEESDQAFSHDFQQVEPIGKAAGHPPKRMFPLKDDIALKSSSNTPLHRRYAIALRALIDEMKKERAGRRTIQLENGEAILLDFEQKAFRFQCDDIADLFEGASVIAKVGAKESSGHIVAVMEGWVIVSLEGDFGDQISSCVLRVDNTAMLEALAKQLENVNVPAGKEFNGALAAMAVTNRPSKKGQPPESGVSVTDFLNDSQQAAVSMALENQISYIWGPPGTGKTRSLTELIRILFEKDKRILICSNTNQAVDQVLLQLCEALGAAHKAIESGAVIRVGQIENKRLAHAWSSYVTLPGIVRRQSVTLHSRLKDLENQIAPLRERIVDIDRLLKLVGELDAARKEERLLLARSDSVEGHLHSLHGKLSKLSERLATLGREPAGPIAAGLLGRFFMRLETAFLGDRQSVREQITTIQNKLQETDRESVKVREDVGAARNRIRELEDQIPDGAPSERLQSRKAEAEKELKPLLSERSSILGKLTDIERTVIQEARIIGATVAKMYLSPNQYKSFHIVIVDEASMVMLPALYYVAGLASERVVISGDFRQLRPIVATKQKAIAEAIGIDVFKATGITDALEKDASPPRLVMLNTQYRMQKAICDLISSAMYHGRLKTQRATADFGDSPPSPFDQTLTVIDTSRIWPFVNRDAFRSPYNLMHALAVRNLCLHLREHGFASDPGNVGVATPYRAQAKLILRILKGCGIDGVISAGTVHRYQGDEKRLMILDIPDSWGEARVCMFSGADNPQDEGAQLFNVGISRARDYLMIVANLTYLQDKLPDRALLRDILHAMQTRGRVVDVRDVLALHPVFDDLKDLLNHLELELKLDQTGLFRQKDFEAVCTADVALAKESVAVFSAFVTPQRVAAYHDLFRRKISEGVRIRCVTRPPCFNGTIPMEDGKSALDALEGIGCIVDTRSNIHEKVVIIDDRIVWFGSLNMLSHNTKTDEMMMRIDNAEAAEQLGIFMTLRPTSSHETGKGLSTKPENPRCPKCRSRTHYAKGKFGAFWSCEEGDWTETFDKPKWPPKTPSSGAAASQKQAKSVPKCAKCGSPMVRKTGPYGDFYGCSRFPACKGKGSL